MNAIQEARDYLEQYQYRINNDNFRGDLENRTRWENCGYQEGMLQAAIAQAEHLKRIADALEAQAQWRQASDEDETGESWRNSQEFKRDAWEAYDNRPLT